MREAVERRPDELPAHYLLARRYLPAEPVLALRELRIANEAGR